MRTTQPGRVIEFMTWTLLGVGAGVATGMLLGEWLDWRLSRGPVGDEKPSVKLGSTARTVSTVRDALADHPSFASLEVAVQAVAPGVVELGGWVDDRTTRGRLARFTNDLPGIDDIINSVLVRGEDDLHGHNGHQASPTG